MHGRSPCCGTSNIRRKLVCRYSFVPMRRKCQDNVRIMLMQTSCQRNSPWFASTQFSVGCIDANSLWFASTQILCGFRRRKFSVVSVDANSPWFPSTRLRTIRFASTRLRTIRRNGARAFASSAGGSKRASEPAEELNGKRN